MISEADAEDYKQQDREDKRRGFLERRGRMGGPDAPEDCERCGGKGYRGCKPCQTKRECPRCLG
ncbi:hypothetical protein LCGC14_2321430, partial [marine sediment metagenome]